MSRAFNDLGASMSHSPNLFSLSRLLAGFSSANLLHYSRSNREASWERRSVEAAMGSGEHAPRLGVLDAFPSPVEARTLVALDRDVGRVERAARSLDLFRDHA
jgi:hypothetical protein